MFELDVGMPNPSRTLAPEDESVGEAVETVFVDSGQYMHLRLNDADYALDYKYDVSCIIEDLIMLVRAALSAYEGQKSIAFACSAFPLNWLLKWQGEKLTLTAIEREELGQRRIVCQLEQKAFVREARKLFVVIADALRTAGYDVASLRHGNELLGLISSL